MPGESKAPNPDGKKPNPPPDDGQEDEPHSGSGENGLKPDPDEVVEKADSEMTKNMGFKE